MGVVCSWPRRVARPLDAEGEVGAGVRPLENGVVFLRRRPSPRPLSLGPGFFGVVMDRGSNSVLPVLDGNRRQLSTIRKNLL